MGAEAPAPMDDFLHAGRRLLSAAIIAACVVGAASEALAQDDGESMRPPSTDGATLTPAEKEALRLFQIGQLQFEGQEFAAAALTFEKAFALDPNAVLAYNVARACENDGQLDKASSWYEKTLTLEPSDEVRARASAALVRIERAREAIQKEVKATARTTAHLVVRADVAAEVRLDGVIAGTTPFEQELEPRTYDIEILAEGRLPYRQTVTLQAGDRLQVSAALQEPPSLLSWLGWTGMGVMVVGGVAIGGGAYYESDARATWDEANQLAVKRSPERFEELRSDGEYEKSVAATLYLAGAGVVGVGVVLLTVDLVSNLSADSEPAAGTAPRGVQLGVASDRVLLSVPF